MTAQRALAAGGILNLLFALFHILFPWIFSWSKDLQTIAPANRAILYTFHSVMVFVLIAFAYLSIAYRAELLATRLGRSVLFVIGTVWFIRAVAEVIFFRFGADGAVWRLVLFLALSLIYLLSWLLRRGSFPATATGAASN